MELPFDIDADTLLARLQPFWIDAVGIWSDGGWAMIAIAVLSFVLFSVGVNVHVTLRSRFQKVPERLWRRWIDHPRERRGRVGELLSSVSKGRTLGETTRLFDRVIAAERAPFERDLRVMKICVSAAPLVGLLGTVTGMLSTFGALATGSGGDKTMEMVAAGISEALITTETGLVIAIPGLFYRHQLVRNLDRYKAFLAHVQTVYTQSLHRRLTAQLAPVRAAATTGADESSRKGGESESNEELVVTTS